MKKQLSPLFIAAAFAVVMTLAALVQAPDAVAALVAHGQDWLQAALAHPMGEVTLAMATLAVDKPRTYVVRGYEATDALPVIASDIIYEGAAVGDNASGLARPLVAADPFLGFAERQCDNSAGAASAKNVRVRLRGAIVLPVVGAASAADVGETVYASDDDTFTLTAGSNTAIGKVSRWISSTTCEVEFEALQARSL